MAIEKIIVIDDEMIIRKTMQEHLRKRRYIVATAQNIKEAEELLKKDHFDLIFVDAFELGVRGHIVDIFAHDMVGSEVD